MNSLFFSTMGQVFITDRLPIRQIKETVFKTGSLKRVSRCTPFPAAILSVKRYYGAKMVIVCSVAHK
jgi:hypothetical protein